MAGPKPGKAHQPVAAGFGLRPSFGNQGSSVQPLEKGKGAADIMDDADMQAGGFSGFRRAGGLVFMLRYRRSHPPY
jgi:hypothetical protein